MLNRKRIDKAALQNIEYRSASDSKNQIVRNQKHLCFFFSAPSRYTKPPGKATCLLRPSSLYLKSAPKNPRSWLPRDPSHYASHPRPRSSFLATTPQNHLNLLISKILSHKPQKATKRPRRSFPFPPTDLPAQTKKPTVPPAPRIPPPPRTPPRHPPPAHSSAPLARTTPFTRGNGIRSRRVCC